MSRGVCSALPHPNPLTRSLDCASDLVPCKSPSAQGHRESARKSGLKKIGEIRVHFGDKGEGAGRESPLRERYLDIEIAHRRDDLVSAKAIKGANQPRLFKMAKTKQAHSR